MTTFVAALGPRFVTLMWKVIKVAALACAGPLFAIRRSAAAVAPTTLVVTLEELFAVLPSNVELLTLAVLVMVVPL
jgi:hypothetical protein